MGKGLSPQSYGKHTAIALFSDSGAPDAIAKGATVEHQGVVKGRNDRRSAERKKLGSRSSREDATCDVSSASVSGQNTPKLPPSNQRTNPRKSRETARGRPVEVGGSGPCTKAERRRAPLNSGRGTPIPAYFRPYRSHARSVSVQRN